MARRTAVLVAIRPRRCIVGGGLALVALVVVAIAATLIAASAASAETLDPYFARDHLVRARLSPTPLYPTVLPGKIGCCDTELTHHGRGFEVTLTEKNEQGFLNRLVSFRRGSYGELYQQIRFTRAVQRDPVRVITVGGRQMYYGRGDISFYLTWHAQGLTYTVSSKYYDPSVTIGQLRELAASVEPLGVVYDGTTALSARQQGRIRGAWLPREA